MQWKLETDSPIDATQLQLNPKAWYTDVPGMANIKNENGDYALTLTQTYTMDLYPVNTLVAPQTPYIVKAVDLNPDGTLPVSFTINGATLSPGDNKNVAFTIKRAGMLLAKKVLPFTNIGFISAAGGSLNVKVAVGDTLYFDFSSREITDITEVGNNEVRVGLPPSADEPAHLAPSVIHIAAVENILPQSYRGWDVFGLNGNSPRNETAIDQSLFLLKDLNSGDCSGSNTNGCATAASKVLLYAYAPDPVTLHWVGPDASAWISFDGASSTRLGLKNISMPRGSQFAGASAPPRMSHSYSVNASVGVGASTGYSESQLDFQDLNGDRFPDLVGQNGVQYTAMAGGLTGSMKSTAQKSGDCSPNGSSVARNSCNTSFSVSSSGVSSMAAAIGNALGNVNPSGKASASTGTNGPTEPSFGINGGKGTSDAHSELIDINGDGLPDQVSKDGTVRLNMGYGFVDDGNWGGGAVNAGETINGGLTMGYSIDNGSISGGLNLGIGDSHTNETYVDLNGDGLPDKVIPIPNTNNFKVFLNTGEKISDTYIVWQGGQGGIAADKNISLGAGGSYTVGFVIPIVSVKAVFTMAANVTTNVGRPELAFRDMDGDGFVDQAYSIKDNELSIATNQIGRTNLLKEIKRPLGATISLEYERTGNTYPMPQSRWVMNKVTVNDGFASDGVDTLLNTYQYKNGYYNRLERDFYGFAKVIEEQRDINKPDSVYRKVTSSYFNGNYYGKGLELSSLTSDGNDSKYIESVNTYRLRDISNPGTDTAIDDPVAGASTTATLFPMLTKSERGFYEGGQGYKGTYTTQLYDEYGNITRFFDAGESGNPADDVEASISYSTGCLNNYIIGKPTLIEVKGKTTKRIKQNI